METQKNFINLNTKPKAISTNNKPKPLEIVLPYPRPYP